MKNKIFTRIIITTLLCAFLTLNVGKVTRVSAVGTTIAASAAAALCAVGIVYCSYMALSGASVHIPDSVENIEDWLTDMGSKVVQYPSGRAAYEEIYPELLGIGDEPLTSLLDRAWTWTSDKLKSWANDFSSTDVVTNIATFNQSVDISQVPTNGYTYDFTIQAIPDIVNWDGTNYTFEQLVARGFTITPVSQWNIVYYSPTAGHASSFPIKIDHTDVRNVFDGTYYRVEYRSGHSWVTVNTTTPLGYDAVHSGGAHRYIIPAISDLSTWGLSTNMPNYSVISTTAAYPQIANAPIYDEVTEEYRPMIIPSSEVTVRNPQWPTLPPDDDNKPVIPYLKLPYDPNWVDPVTGLPGGGNWGFNLAQLLDALEDLAGLLMEIGAIGELINQFKDSVGDTYYIYYDDSEHNETYYQYYTITNFGNNNYTYNINVSDADEHLPVDLNTIQNYSSNRYLEQIKQSAINGSSIVRDFAVFWYDVDPEITYIALGICIVILLGAFTGKLGHS